MKKEKVINTDGVMKIHQVISRPYKSRPYKSSKEKEESKIMLVQSNLIRPSVKDGRGCYSKHVEP